MGLGGGHTNFLGYPPSQVYPKSCCIKYMLLCALWCYCTLPKFSLLRYASIRFFVCVLGADGEIEARICEIERHLNVHLCLGKC